MLHYTMLYGIILQCLAIPNTASCEHNMLDYVFQNRLLHSGVGNVEWQATQATLRCWKPDPQDTFEVPGFMMLYGKL